MRRTTRTAAGALAIAVALGAGSPVAASAAGHDKPVHAKPVHSKAEKSTKAEKGDARKVAQELRQLLREIEKADQRLGRVAKEARTARIGEHAAAVASNVATDRAALVELTTAVQAADTALDPRAVRKELRDVREENYHKVVNDLRHALKLAAQLDAARVALVDDPAAPLGDLDTAQVALDAAVAKALSVTASSGKSELRAVKSDLEAAHAAFEVVRAYLETVTPDEELTEEEPTEEAPVEGDPVV